MVKCLTKLAQLLLLFSWKLVGIAPDESCPCGKEHTKNIAKYHEVYQNYIGADAVPRIMQRDEAQIEADDLTILRKELHAAASSLVLFTFFSAYEPAKVPLHVGLNHFQAAHGTSMAHVFQVGSGKFPLIESFFSNFERLYSTMWMKRPIPANLELPVSTAYSGKVKIMQGTRLPKVKVGSKCSICKNAIDGAFLYPMAYSVSKNDACYPRKIFLSDLDEDEYDQIYDIEELNVTMEGMACSPLCMVQYLRSIILEVNLLFRNAGLPKFFLMNEMGSPLFREFSKRVLKLLKHSNLHLFIRSALIPQNEPIILRRIPIHEIDWGICSPDYSDPRFRPPLLTGRKKLSRLETLPMGLSVVDPWSLRQTFGLEYTSNAVDVLCRMRSKNPDASSLLGQV